MRKWTYTGSEHELAHHCFKFFDCKGTFNIILGKPWLREVRAQHDYTTDKIVIGRDGHQEVISNILDTTEEDTKHAKQTLQVETKEQQETYLEEQLAKEWDRITQMDATTEAHELSPSETRIRQLRNHLDALQTMARNATTNPDRNSDTDEAMITATGDVMKNEFKIDRSTNTLRRVLNAFDEP